MTQRGYVFVLYVIFPQVNYYAWKVVPQWFSGRGMSRLMDMNVIARSGGMGVNIAAVDENYTYLTFPQLQVEVELKLKC